MPNIATALKTEIARVARKEIKTETSALKSATSKFRAELTALRKQIAALQKDLKRASKTRPSSQESAEPDAAQPRHRFSPKRLAAQRKRLGLSAESLGKLIGVSGLSIYHWEGGKSRPRVRHLPAIAALRTLGAEEAAAVLASR